MTIHWTKLKKAVEDAGGTWTTREEAEAFLANAGVSVPDEAVTLAGTFDSTKDYSEVFGDIGVPGACFSQGGRYFNTKGEQVG